MKPQSTPQKSLPAIGLLSIFTLGSVGIAVAASLVIRFHDIDLSLSRLWWHTSGQWFGKRSAVCDFLNDFGPLPGLALALGGLLTGVVACILPRQRHLAAPALYFVLAFLLGPGLVVNGIMKHTWARARPKDTVTFGGRQHHEKVLTHEPASLGRSFPSGHASTAFYLCSLGFASAAWGQRRHMYSGLAVGVTWGLLVGWARIASGAHFLSDILWSGAVVTLVNGALLVVMLRWHAHNAVSTQTRPLAVPT